MPDDEAPFLAAIHDSGGDVLPSLVFADWLEERGDPRGEFIRLQCEPSLGVADELRMQGLLIDHEGEWLAPLRRSLGPLDGLVAEYGFRNGLPAGVRMSSADCLQGGLQIAETWPGLTDWTLSYRQPPLERLPESTLLSRVRGLGFSDPIPPHLVDGLLRSPHLKDLRRLSLKPCLAPSHLLSVLTERAHVESLEELSIPGEFGDHAAEILAAMPFPSLRRLNIPCEHVRQWNVLTQLPIAEWMTSLESLELWGQPLGRFVRDLDCSPTIPALRHLDLSGTDAALPFDEWEETRGLPKLESLSANRCQLMARHLRNLARVPWLSGLRRLSVAENVFSNEGLEWIAQSDVFSALEYLNLGNCGIDDEGLEALARSPALRLSAINLHQSRVSARVLDHFLTSEAASGLRWLTVGGLWEHNGPATAEVLAARLPELPIERLKLSDFAEGTECLRRLSGVELPFLREFSLLASKVDDRGVGFLANSDWLQQLRVLDLSNNAVGQAGVIALTSYASLPRLRRLGFSSNRLNGEAVAHLLDHPSLGGIRRLKVEQSSDLSDSQISRIEIAPLDRLLSLSMGFVDDQHWLRLKARLGAKIRGTTATGSMRMILRETLTRE